MRNDRPGGGGGGGISLHLPFRFFYFFNLLIFIARKDYFLLEKVASSLLRAVRPRELGARNKLYNACARDKRFLRTRDFRYVIFSARALEFRFASRYTAAQRKTNRAERKTLPRPRKRSAFRADTRKRRIETRARHAARFIRATYVYTIGLLSDRHSPLSANTIDREGSRGAGKGRGEPRASFCDRGLSVRINNTYVLTYVAPSARARASLKLRVVYYNIRVGGMAFSSLLTTPLGNYPRISACLARYKARFFRYPRPALIYVYTFN